MAEEESSSEGKTHVVRYKIRRLLFIYVFFSIFAYGVEHSSKYTYIDKFVYIMFGK